MNHLLINKRFQDIPIDYFQNLNINLIIFDPSDNIDLKYDEYEDNISDDIYIALIEEWLYKCKNITNGPIFFTFNIKWTSQVENIIDTLQIQLIQRLYWKFTFGQNQKKKYTNSLRPIYWLNSDFIIPENIKIPSDRQVKYNDKRARKGGKMPNNSWEFSRICGTFKERRSWHPCQINEKVVERIISGHSNIGDTILDPMIGSGTSAIVSERLRRNSIGIDTSQFYLDKIKECVPNATQIYV